MMVMVRVTLKAMVNVMVMAMVKLIVMVMAIYKDYHFPHLIHQAQ